MTDIKHVFAMTMIASMLVSTATATSYYVDSQNGSDSRDGTSGATSWQTLSKVNGATFAAGDSVLFKCGGAWTGSLTIANSGTSNNPITYASYGSGDQPVIKVTTVTTVVQVLGSWIVLDGLHIIGNGGPSGNATWAVDIPGSAHVTLTNCEIDNAGTGVRTTGHFILITHCNIHDMFTIRDDPGGDNDYGANGVALHSGASDIEISYCRLVNLAGHSYDYGQDGGAVELWCTVSRLKVHHNYANHCCGFLESGGSSGQPVDDISIYYNVIVNSSFSGSSVLNPHDNPGDNFWIVPSNWRFFNNTCINSSGVGGGAYLACVNNIGDGSSDTFGGVASNNFSGDPLFVNKDAGDYHLLQNSPCIDAGATMNSPLDFDDVFVPQGLAPDIGAFEYKMSPICAITAPSDGAVVKAETNLTIEATASAWRATVSKVEFYADGEKIGEDTTDPYTCEWSNVPAGYHELTALATDSIGNTGDSAVVCIDATVSGLREDVWARATGGTVTKYTLNGTNYKAHIFSTVGTTNLNVTADGIVEYLVVAGGGGGGSGHGGGGGAGGFLTGATNVTAGTNTIIVGKGGAATNNANTGNPGSNSVFGTITAFGGGGGRSYNMFVADYGGGGGSGGGGGGQYNQAGGPATSGQGKDGGNAYNAQNGGGGGGAGAKGADTSGSSDGGAGGSGTNSTFASGAEAWYAGGGGGGGNEGGGVGGAGGQGGGGRGGDNGSTANMTAGTPGTGGGGGGNRGSGSAAGGSGIVIVRYVTGGALSAYEQWRRVHFTSEQLENIGVDTADPDGDGMKNLDEFYAGTIPTNRLSVLCLTDTSFHSPSSEFVIRWQSATGKYYTVQATTNLLNGFGPIPGATNILATYPVNVYTDNTATVGQKFYRIRVTGE